MTAKPYDHRDSEYGLQAAVAYAVHKRALGDLMVLHGKRAGPHPDVAAISSEESLTLVELKLRTVSESEALQELCQVADYTLRYRRESVATLAKWYCHSMVESLCGLSYRGDEKGRVLEPGEHLFHRVEQFDKARVRAYRAAAARPTTAYDRFAGDFEQRFGHELSAGADAPLRVARVVLVAEVWTENARRAIDETIAHGFDRARLERAAKHKHVAKVLKDPEAFALITTLNISLRVASPAKWIEPLEPLASTTP